MEPVTIAKDPSSPQTDLAYRRIDALLHAYGMQHAAIRSAEAQRILQNALSSDLSDTHSLETLAAEQVFREVNEGLLSLKQHLTEIAENGSNEKLLLALKKTNIPLKHPQTILGNTSPTEIEWEDLRQTYRRQNTPLVKRSSMGASALKFESIEEVTSHTSAFFERYPIARRAVQICTIALFLYILFSFSR